jgi:hypothetical protein
VLAPSEWGGSLQAVQRFVVAFQSVGAFLGGTIAFFWTASVSPHRAPRDFFDASAQLAVVLLLAAAYQARLFSIDFSAPLPPARWAVLTFPPWFDKFKKIYDLANTMYFILIIGAAIFVGEVNSLSVLVSFRKEADPTLVLASLVAATVAIVLSVTIESLSSSKVIASVLMASDETSDENESPPSPSGDATPSA